MFGKEENCSGEGRVPLLEKVPSFDDLSRELASGTISRSRAIKLTGGALLSTALAAFSSSPAEARRRNPCRGKRTTCETGPSLGPHCLGNANCFCVRTTGGSKACVDLSNEQCPATDECNRASDCARNEVCAVVAGCCGGSPRNLCVRKCRR